MIESYFPTLLYRDILAFNHMHKAYESIIRNVQKNVESTNLWDCDTYGSIGVYDLRDDITFIPLIECIKVAVNDFATSYGISKAKSQCSSAWFNIASPGNFQEYHMHANSHFSAVYYVKAPANCGDLVLKSHEADTNMFLLPMEDMTPATWNTLTCPAEEGRLYIFRSNLQHMVQKNRSQEDRISLAFNFEMKHEN